MIRRVPFLKLFRYGDGGSEQGKMERTTKKPSGPVPQVCEHQRGSCFVDVVASQARFNTEVLHPFSSLALPDSFQVRT